MKYCVWLVLSLAIVLNGLGAESAPVMPGVRKMAERLQGIIRAENPMDNPFRNVERAAIFEDYVRNEKNPQSAWETLPMLAGEQLKAGKPTAALASYRK